MFIIKLILYLVITNTDSEITNKPFQLSVVHFNDFHARFEPTNLAAGPCKEPTKCIGGFSRLYKQIMTMLDENPQSLLLNAGDSFQGTLWYSIGRWNVTQYFINKLPVDAETIGNHEFDHGIQGLVPYIKALKHSIVVSNIDDSLEPDFQGIYNKSIVIERNNKKIGIIGVVSTEYPVICNTEKLKFLDESASINAEAERLVREEGVFTNIILSHCGYPIDKRLAANASEKISLIVICNTEKLKFLDESSSINAEAERLVREEGVFTNIILSHCGYPIDKRLAANASEKISLIVGSHSHTFLWTGDNPPGPAEVEGPYPTIVESKYGHKVLITQASAYSRYLGNITIFLDDNGEILDYSGAPIFLNTDYPQDENINLELEPWKELVDIQGEEVVGSSLVTLSNTGCFYRECSLGNFITDVMVYAYTNIASDIAWTEAAVAFINAAGLRTDIDVGDITFNALTISQPFENSFDFGTLTGKDIKDLLEFTVEDYTPQNPKDNLKLLQVSGMKLVYDLSRGIGDRLISAKIRCQNCTVPVYEDLKLNRDYNVIICTYLLAGGNGFTIFKNKMRNIRVGPKDIDVLVEYLGRKSPVFQEEYGRLTFKLN